MLIFDLDGTLIDSNGVWVEVDKIFLSRRGFGGRSGFFLPLLFFLFTDPLCFLLSGL